MQESVIIIFFRYLGALMVGVAMFIVLKRCDLVSFIVGPGDLREAVNNLVDALGPFVAVAFCLKRVRSIWALVLILASSLAVIVLLHAAKPIVTALLSQRRNSANS